MITAVEWLMVHASPWGNDPNILMYT